MTVSHCCLRTTPTCEHQFILTDLPEFYWFEVLECGRRLLLASIIGIVSDDANAAPVMGIIISIGFDYVFTNYKPYKDPNNSFLGIVLAYSLVFFFLAAVMIKLDATGDDVSDQVVFGVLLICVLVAGPATILLGASWELLKAKMSTKGTTSDPEAEAEHEHGNVDHEPKVERKLKRSMSVDRKPPGTPIP
jgi:hypothetical protein